MSHGPPVHHENGLYCGPAVGSGDVGILLVPRESVLSLTRELPVPRTVAPSTPSRIAAEEALLGRAGGGAPGLSPRRLRSAPRALSHLRFLRRCRGGGADPRIGRGGHPPAGHVGARRPALRQWRVVRGPWGAGLLGARPSQPVARPPQDRVPGPAGLRGGPAHRLARGGGRQPRHPAPTPALHPLAARGDRAGRAHQRARSRAPVGPPRRSPSTSAAAGLPPRPSRRPGSSRSWRRPPTATPSSRCGSSTPSARTAAGGYARPRCSSVGSPASRWAQLSSNRGQVGGGNAASVRRGNTGNRCRMWVVVIKILKLS